MKRRKAN